MQICTDHWTALSAEVDSSGMKDLVARDGDEAQEKLVAQVQGADGRAGFDPLMGANFAIFSAFLEDAGIEGLGLEGCPLCEVGKQSPDVAQEWIRGSVNDQLGYARKLGLMPALQ